MSITGEYIHRFQYVEYTNKNIPSSIADCLIKKIVDVESKHVADFRDTTEKFFKYSDIVGYSNTILGIHRNTSIKNELFRVQNMCQSICNRAVRFVITKDERIWADNTHWSLAYILQTGIATLISDIPMYIIDFREPFPIIYDKEGVVFDSINDIKNAIASSERIQNRLNLGWRPLGDSYTIGRLYQDLLSIIDEEDDHGKN